MLIKVFIVVFCLIITCFITYYLYKWKTSNCYYDARLRDCCKCCQCKCSCDGSCDCWCCCINGCCPVSGISTVESYNDIEVPGTRNESHEGGDEVDLRNAYLNLPPAGTPAVTVQPLNDFEINQFVPDLDADQRAVVQIDDLPTFDQALQMEVISSGAPTKKLMHQSSSKSDDLPPTYDAVEFHPVLLPGNTYFTYLDGKTVQPGTKL